MMLGLRPTSRRSGKVNVLGFDPAREPLQAKRRVGYLPDSVGFYDHLTAIENLSYTAKLMGLSFPERSQRIADALSCVHLSDVAHKRVATFFARYAAANRVGPKGGEKIRFGTSYSAKSCSMKRWANSAARLLRGGAL